MSDNDKKMGDQVSPPMDYGTDDLGEPIWSEDDQALVSKNDWTVYVVFLFIPLLALVVLLVFIRKLFVHLLSALWPKSSGVVKQDTQNIS